MILYFRSMISLILITITTTSTLIVAASNNNNNSNDINDHDNNKSDIVQLQRQRQQQSQDNEEEEEEEGASTTTLITFGAMPGNTPFYEPFEFGWNDRCEELNIHCLYKIPQLPSSSDDQNYDNNNNINATATTNNNNSLSSSSSSSNSNEFQSCYDIISDFIKQNVDGIALQPCAGGNSAGGNINKEETANLTNLLDNSGIPYVTFDSDLTNSTRFSYIGTDNEFMGRTMARLLKQLRPEGGSFVIIATKEDRYIGFQEEILKDNHRDDRPHWNEIIDTNIPYVGGGEDGFAQQMKDYALKYKNDITAMIIMRQTPMRYVNWTQLHETYIKPHNITIIGTDGADYQLDLLTRRYVDGLIGQLPYDMGSFAVQALYDNIVKQKEDTNNKKTPIPDIIKTNLVSYNLIPLELPELNVDQNLLDGLKYIGITCFVVIAFSSILCIIWTIMNRRGVVVKASQPFFLIMTAMGILIMASTLIPLSFDDSGNPNEISETLGIGICMSIPWLAFVGFTITFSALFAKTWRINKMLGASKHCTHTTITPKDVLWPFVVLLTANFIILICWTIIDPLMYIREFADGTDFWNREFASYGVCRSSNSSVPYLVPLALVNLSVLIIACWQAIVARGIETEFSEANYIGLSVFSLCQAFLTGIPIVAIVRDIPEAFYLVLTFLIFLLCSVILLLIFLPKMILQRKYAGMTEKDQKELLALKVRKSMEKSRTSGFTNTGYDPQYQHQSDHIQQTQQSHHMYYDPSKQFYHHQDPYHTTAPILDNGANKSKILSTGSATRTVDSTGPKQAPVSKEITPKEEESQPMTMEDQQRPAEGKEGKESEEEVTFSQGEETISA